MPYVHNADLAVDPGLGIDWSRFSRTFQRVAQQVFPKLPPPPPVAPTSSQVFISKPRLLFGRTTSAFTRAPITTFSGSKLLYGRTGPVIQPPPPTARELQRIPAKLLYGRTRIGPVLRTEAPIVLSRRTLPTVIPAPPPPAGITPPAAPPPTPMAPYAGPSVTPVATPEPEPAETAPASGVQFAGLSGVQLAVIAGVVLFVLPGLFKAKGKGRRK